MTNDDNDSWRLTGLQLSYKEAKVIGNAIVSICWSWKTMNLRLNSPFFRSCCSGLAVTVEAHMEVAVYFTGSTWTASQQVLLLAVLASCKSHLPSLAGFSFEQPFFSAPDHWSWLLARSSHLSMSMIWYMFVGGLKLKEVFNWKYFTVVIKWKICSFNCCFVCC